MATNLCSRKRTQYVSVKDFAEMYSIAKSQAYKLINEGLPTYRVGSKCIRIPIEEAQRYLDQKYNS